MNLNKTILITALIMLLTGIVYSATGTVTSWYAGYTNISKSAQDIEYGTSLAIAFPNYAYITNYSMNLNILTEDATPDYCYTENSSTCDGDFNTGYNFSIAEFYENYSILPNKRYNISYKVNGTLNIFAMNHSSGNWFLLNATNINKFIYTFELPPDALTTSNLMLKINSSIIYDSCYQETANISTECGGLDTGTYVGAYEGSASSYMPVNYTKPYGAVGAIWKIKHGFNDSMFKPVPDECWNANPTQLNFVMFTTSSASACQSKLGCYNVTGDINGGYKTLSWDRDSSPTCTTGISIQTVNKENWAIDGNWLTNTVRIDASYNYYNNNTGAVKNVNIYEEGIFWELNMVNTYYETKIIAIDTVQNLSIRNTLNDELLFNEVHDIKNGQFTASLNTTKINTAYDNNCQGGVMYLDNCYFNVYIETNGSWLDSHITLLNASYIYGIDNCSQFTYIILNTSYYDESTFLPITASNNYELMANTPYSQTVSGTLPSATYGLLCTNINTTNRGYNISISGIMTISSSGYDTRIIINDASSSYITQTNPYYLLSLYLIDSGNTSNVQFTVKDSLTKNTIQNVLIRLYHLQGGEYLLVESKLTDATGKASMQYITNDLYRVIFSSSAYNTLTYDFNPFSSSSYDILMVKSIIQNTTQTFDRVTIESSPHVFYTGSNLFTINFDSPFNEFNTYQWELTFPGGTDSDSGTTAGGETFANVPIVISGATLLDRVKLKIDYNTLLAGNRSLTYYYDILNITEANYTMMGLKNKTYGLGLFERLFISGFIVLFIVGIASLMGQPLPGLLIGMAIYGYFVYIGFIPIWVVIIPIFIGAVLIGSRSE